MSSIIELDQVTVDYRSRAGLFKIFKHRALNGVTFSIRRGEVFGVLGGNGSGKSTLLQVLSGVISPNKGAVNVEPNTSRSLLSLGLGFNPALSGRDNAVLSCMLNGLSLKEAESLIPSIKEFSELGKFFERPVKSYSAGMKSRLGFSAAIEAQVDLLLIDEVLSVGDAHFKRKAEEAMLQKLNSEQTVVFVSHSSNQVSKLCDRCMWLDAGEVRMMGNTKEVVKHYNLEKGTKGE